MKYPKNFRRERVLTHMLNNLTITRDYARSVFHVQNLAQVVMELRRMGWAIGKGIIEQEDGVKVVHYFIPRPEFISKRNYGKILYSLNRNRFEPVLD